MKLRLALAVVGALSYASSGPRAARFFGGKAREALRKLRNEVFPEFLAPTTRTLFEVSQVIWSRESKSLLVRCGVFSSPNSSWVCHCANSTTCIAVSSSMCHTLGSGIRVDNFIC
jgi:hypothetical protein